MQRLLFGVIPIYGLLIAGSMALGVYLCATQEERLGLPKDPKRPPLPLLYRIAALSI